ncbi:hypothetical protein [Thermoactinomyces mirandus]|uniref:Uncharacterized protein n=1 Tax=Thermoactinomyces mirandus TaxID=2756294 RepID=A0A7W1XTM1_9BACL|nr:hypothetical protein [Thermoactinomyces mirandus]MBA4602860.1 hypothetical protein [Thermoactinomyces mirandus]
MTCNVNRRYNDRDCPSVSLLDLIEEGRVPGMVPVCLATVGIMSGPVVNMGARLTGWL